MKYLLLLGICLVSSLCNAQVEIRCHNMSWEGYMATTKISNVVQDEEGYLWFGSLNGLFRYDGYRFKCYQQKGNYQVTKLHQWKKGKLLVQLRGGHHRLFDIETGSFDTLTSQEQERIKKMTMPPSRKELPDNLHKGYKRLFWDNMKNIVADDGNGTLKWIERHTGETIVMEVYSKEYLSQGNNPYYSVIHDERRKLLWVSTNGNGLFVYDRTTHTLQHFGRHTEQQTGIDTDLFVSISLDREGNIWACKDNAPPACITVMPRGTRQLSLIPDAKDERTREVKTLKRTGNGVLLVSNNNGENFLTKWQWNPKQMKELNGIDVITACHNPATYDLILGARRHGVRIDNQWYTHTTESSSLGFHRVNDALVDHKGRIWLAVFEGGLDLAVKGDTGGYTFRHFFTKNGRVQTGRKLLQDDKGRIWYGTGNGLFSFMPDSLIDNSQKFEFYSLDGENIVEIHDLLLDRKQRLWVCTHGQGVFVIDTKTNDIKQLTTNEGLVYDATQSAVEDGEGNIWIGTVNGLSCYHTNEGRFSNYHFASSERGNFFSESAAVYANGELRFGTLDGVMHLPHLLYPSDESGVVITDVLVNEENHDLTLPHDAGLVTFCFSNLRFAAHKSARYEYRLEGYDERWSLPTTKGEAVYRHLPPGEYTFRVRMYERQEKVGDEATVDIIVLPPWWRTWWAYLSYVLIAIFSLGLIMRYLYTLNRLRNRIVVERQLTEYKLRFFTNISHEFRTPLTIIQGSMERLQKMENELPSSVKSSLSTINKSSKRLLRLINQLMEFRKMQNGKLELHLQETEIIGFVREICNNFKDAAKGKNIDMQYLPFTHSYKLYIDREHVDKMVYNLVSNAVKYTPVGGGIIINVRLDSAWIAIIVTDTGVGIPKEKQKELFSRFMQSSFLGDSIGIGLNLTWELAQAHHGTVNFKENPQGGSIFTIKLPADKSAYKEGEFLLARRELTTETVAEKVVWLEHFREMPPVPMNNDKVLLVDDDNDVLEFLEKEMRPYFNVETANDGQEAIEKLQGKDFVLVISDVKMPRINGYQLTQFIRKDRQLNRLPIILLTANTGESQEIKAIEKGADVYLSKPFSPEVLINYCKRLLEKKKSAENSKGSAANDTVSSIIINEREHRFLKKLDAWIDAHLSEPISTEDMATAMDVGRTTLFDKLKLLVGQTPSRYVQQRKMRRAQQLLREGNMTTKQIAYNVGFDDPHYFSIRFKALFGMTPSEYAKTSTGEHS